MSAAIASCAARLISAGAGKSGKPWARLTASYIIAFRVISRITDSVKCATLPLRNDFVCLATSPIVGEIIRSGGGLATGESDDRREIVFAIVPCLNGVPGCKPGLRRRGDHFPWQCLNFLPLLQGHGSFLPIFSPEGVMILPRRCPANFSNTGSAFHGSLIKAIASTSLSLVAMHPRASHTSALDLYLAIVASARSLFLSTCGELGSDRIVMPLRLPVRSTRASWLR